MAEKKQAKPKAKAKPEPKADFELAMKTDESAKLVNHSNDHDDFINAAFSEDLEAAIDNVAVPMTLQYSASDLAAMARKAKAGKADMQDVIAEHDIYLSLVKMGASAPAADVEFVKNHMKYLKTL